MKYFILLCMSIFSTFAISGIWDGSSRNISKSALGHELAVACHNCYALNNEGVNLSQALSYIHQGQSAGADLIEIDLVTNSDSWMVSHHGLAGPDFADVFADYGFRNGTQIPFIEIKSNLTNSSDSYYAEKLVNREQTTWPYI